MKYLYKLENINLSYYLKNDDIKVLRNINFEIKKIERVAIIGESGSGKTSLLMLMSGLEKPTTGRIFFDNDSSILYFCTNIEDILSFISGLLEKSSKFEYLKIANATWALCSMDKFP